MENCQKRVVQIVFTKVYSAVKFCSVNWIRLLDQCHYVAEDAATAQTNEDAEVANLTDENGAGGKSTGN